VVPANVVDVVVVDGAAAVDVVVVSPAVEAHPDAMIAMATNPTVAARWMGRLVTAADVKRVLWYSLGALASSRQSSVFSNPILVADSHRNWELGTGKRTLTTRIPILPPISPHVDREQL